RRRSGAPRRGPPPAPPAAAMGFEEPCRRAGHRPEEVASAPESSGSDVCAGPKPFRVVLRFEAQLLRSVRDIPKAPGIGRDAVVDAVTELERCTEGAVHQTD